MRVPRQSRGFTGLITGPEEIRPIANRFGAQWEMETNTLLGNVQAAAYATKPAPSDYIFLVGADMAFPKASAFDSLLANSPQDTGCSTAVITHEMFEATYPGSPSAYVPLKEGRFILGSQFLARAHLKLTPPPVVAAMLGHRKSQLAMAQALGPTVVWGLLTGTLTLPRLEARISELMGVSVHAVRDCAASLAMDVDGAQDYRIRPVPSEG